MNDFIILVSWNYNFKWNFQYASSIVQYIMKSTMILLEYCGKNKQMNDRWIQMMNTENIWLIEIECTTFTKIWFIILNFNSSLMVIKQKKENNKIFNQYLPWYVYVSGCTFLWNIFSAWMHKRFIIHTLNYFELRSISFMNSKYFQINWSKIFSSFFQFFVYWGFRIRKKSKWKLN